jgi:hypothetical protein
MVAALVRCLLTLLGYDRHVVAKLALEDVLFLVLVALLCLVSAGMYALATGYLAYIAVYSDNARWLIAGSIGIGVLVFAITMQRLFVTTGGYAHHWDQASLAQWRPDRLRLWCVFLIASSLSLPFVLMRNHDHLDSSVEESRQTKVAFYRDQLRQSRQARKQALAHQRSLLAARANSMSAPRLGGGSVTASGIEPASTSKKALLIGMQHYQHDRPAPGISEEVKSLQQALRRAGFSTAVSLDGSADTLRLAIDAYLKSLAPGDTSVVYYGGRVLPQAGRNYLMPADYRQAPGANRYAVKQLVDDLAQARLQSATVVLDAASWPGGDPLPTLAAARAAPGTLVALRAAGGASILHADGAGESLAMAVARQIGSGVDLRQALERARANDLGHASLSSSSAGQIRLVDGTQPRRKSAASPSTPGAALAEAAENPEVACAATPGLALQRCLRARLHVVDAKLTALAQGQREDDAAVDQYRRSVERSSMLHERWKLLWAKPTVLIQVCLVIMVMMAGDLLRDLRAGPLRRYEERRAHDARAAVEDAFAHVRHTVGRMLARYPAAPLPGLRWHERPRYFGRPSAALLSLGGVADMPAGSEAELHRLLGLLDGAPPPPASGSQDDAGEARSVFA